MSIEFPKWMHRIADWPWVRKCIQFLSQVKLPGFQGLSLWYVARFFLEAIMRGQLPTRAAAISFRLFLAFFPAMILLLSLIPYIPIDNFQDSLFEGISGFFPGDTFSLFEETFHDLIKRKHSALLSIGFVLVVYYASNSINAILIGFNSSYYMEEKGNVWLLRMASIVLIFILGVFMIVAVALNLFSGILFDYLHEIKLIGKHSKVLLEIVNWLISVSLVYAIITTLYNVGAGKQRRKWSFINVGATFATIIFVITSLGFAYFVNNFGQFNKLYGSLGTLMVLLIWLNFNCMIVLMGFELNMSIRKARKTSKLQHKEVTPPIPIRNEIKSSL
jgi:membrane protein